MTTDTQPAIDSAHPDVREMVPVTRPVVGSARVPGSKSITNRALLVAALARGASTLTGALHSDDTRYMAAALNALGLRVDSDKAGERFAVTGGDGTFPATSADLFVGNSGTSMRFLTATLALGHGRFRIDGVPRMRQRPLKPLLDALTDLGVDARGEAVPGFPPALVQADGLRGGSVAMAGDQSSQFITGLLLASPSAAAGVTIGVTGALVSAPYIAMTIDVMRAFGVEVEADAAGRRFHVPPGQHYAGRAYHIEPDASNASYFFVTAAVTGGRVRVDGLGTNSTQGDLDFVRVLERMGATVTVAPDFTEVTGPSDGQLRGLDHDFSEISDTAQTLAAIAPFAAGPTTIRGIGFIRHKETDRVAAMATELRRLGQAVDEFADGFTIHPAPVQPADVATYDDHRMAMSFAVTGLRAPGVRILDPGCVAKTFPTFFKCLDELVGEGTGLETLC
jgi:3-phosphoshikimate 1-carboxyvinyltransferase